MVIACCIEQVCSYSEATAFCEDIAEKWYGSHAQGTSFNEIAGLDWLLEFCTRGSAVEMSWLAPHNFPTSFA